jgi:alpha-1,2-mannosyltransferase
MTKPRHLLCLLLTARVPVHSGLALLGLFKAGVIISLLLFPVTTSSAPEIRDFHAFWVTAQLSWSDTPAAVYDGTKLTAAIGQAFPAEADKRALGFLYPPPTLLLLAPLAALPFDLAYLVYCAVSLIPFLLFAYFCAGLSGLAVVAGFPALYLCLSYGQISLILTFFLGLATLALGQAPLRAGLWAGLCIFKPQLSFLLGFAALSGRHFRSIATAGVVVFMLAVLSALLFPDTWAAAGQQIGSNVAEPLAGAGWLKTFCSIYALLILYGVSPALALTLQGLSTLYAISGISWIFAKTQQWPHRLIAMGLLPLLATPFAYQYDAVVQLLALIGLMKLSQTEGLSLPELLAILVLYLAPTPALLAQQPSAVMALQLTASFCLLASLCSRVKRESGSTLA